MRCNCAGIFLPPRRRKTASERVTFQRQRMFHIGASSSAWHKSWRTVLEFR